MSELTAFVDESGNSGIKIFSGTDKFHWVGVMLSSYDVELAKNELKTLLKNVGFSELHAGELGLRRINSIARGLIKIYKDIDAKFVFSRVEREHVATMMFVDLLFDSVNNEAAPPELYNVKFNRLLVTYAMAKTLTTEHRKRFWNVLGLIDRGEKEFQELMEEIKQHCIDNPKFISDIEMFSAIFDYAIAHPMQVLELDILVEERARIRREGLREDSDDIFRNNAKYRSANLATFNIAIGTLNHYLKRENLKICKFVHDEQNEFYKQLKNSFDNNTKVIDSSELFSDPVIQTADYFTGDIEFVNSADNIGIQLVDLAIWLGKRVYDLDQILEGECKELFQFIAERGIIDGFSLKDLEYTLAKASR
ncbi:DUF3800 domain-containing protein [Paenibacillus sp. DXFW5]|uniref:DUF3800 domain-containing protein n=1 Tax=Paenibacillus rhizolycopersici TaxID=2780073 RepID=A0ABS2H7F6_9BACL|nr:DUF3800 domain-containing protein [Paenibacillus rhizolycopersici]MBM6995775.1 DUF3800 domain-containing protein [Paenibacillus rhizolycopersici]